MIVNSTVLLLSLMCASGQTDFTTSGGSLQKTLQQQAEEIRGLKARLDTATLDLGDCILTLRMDRRRLAGASESLRVCQISLGGDVVTGVKRIRVIRIVATSIAITLAVGVAAGIGVGVRLAR